mmetsp:Transcript_11089/g.30638  ORF Transcript_11089/g.30638 Transcript_11089/m.30638 type:complete len:342 (-) Transcript_11089:91-1116(-)|eukprot:CAMPEP_0198135248 /NCGR_PEP_ID=MMETSP1442-20131203/60490_1 /TAXON_ID= /ORGANISM="Craspedostauros australis, Strain CCMP3328" /LENGTH=341 /DNA_ID=CAMNT_0043796411 /DNA_START=142 /DNA_END=1167 /DNA_ORIENTATION=-
MNQFSRRRKKDGDSQAHHMGLEGDDDGAVHKKSEQRRLVFVGAMVLIVICGVFATRPLHDVDAVTRSAAVETCEKEQFGQSIAEFMAPFRSDPQLRLCADGKTCQCINPTIGRERQDRIEQWNIAFDAMKGVALQAKQTLGQVDVILLGDSITEHWLGTAMHLPLRRREENAKVFKHLFTKAGGGAIDGVPLGISGDTCSNLLYRLDHDQLQGLQTKVLWVLIGTNDLGRERCTSEAPTAGNIAIVERLRELQPNARIVINSVIPRHSKFTSMIDTMNRRLQCYAATQHNVEYFDATPIFRDPETQALRYMSDQLHPDGSGAMVWGTQIVQRVREIIAESQ